MSTQIKGPIWYSHFIGLTGCYGIIWHTIPYESPKRGANLQQTTNTHRDFQLSLVVPMYNEEEALPIFLERVLPIVEGITSNYEVVCVNDGSRDRTLSMLLDENTQNPRIKVIDLTRNFGKEIALTAGLDYASGNAIIPLDADLQDPPELIPEMIEKWRDGYDMVIGVRSDRSSDTFFKRVTANLFYRAIGKMGEVHIPANAGDFRLLDRRVLEALKQMPERTRFNKGLFAWLGFRQTTITYTRPPRSAGTGKWQAWQLWNFALDGVFSFSTLPLRIWTYFGVVTAIAAISYGVFITLRTFFLGIDVPGYASLVVMLLFFSGLQMVGLGIIGEYLGRVFLEVKQRPQYLVRETVGISAPQAEPISDSLHRYSVPSAESTAPPPDAPCSGQSIHQPD